MKTFLLSIFICAATVASAADWITVKADSVQQYGVIFVPVKVNGVKLDKMLVDTGASITMLPYSDYVSMKKSGMLEKAKFIKDHGTKMGTGTYPTKVYEFDQFEIAGVTIKNVWISFNMSPNAFGKRLLGQNVFRRFSKMYIDWNANEVSFCK